MYLVLNDGIWNNIRNTDEGMQEELFDAKSENVFTY